MDLFPDIEKQPLEVQHQFQFRKLELLLGYLQKHSHYYRRIWKEQNTPLHQINSINDLVRLPTTSKEDLQTYSAEFLCVDRKLIREYTATSGTLGMPVTISLTDNDLRRLAYNEQLSFQNMDIRPGDVVQLMLTLDRQFMAGIAYYNGLQNLGAASVRTGPGLPGMQWEVIHRLNTSTLVAVPSFLIKMLSERPAAYQNIPCPVKKVLAIGESLLTPELQPNRLRQNILKQWDVELYSTYAATEMQTAFTECNQHNGLHHHPELLIVELLDEEGFPVAANEPGEVTITTLGVEGMPLLRYRTGDICRQYTAPCACGRKTIRLGPVLARKKQMIKYKGTTLYPTAITEILSGMNHIKEYVVVIEKDNQEQDRVTIFVYSEDPESMILENAYVAFRQQLRVTPQLKFVTAAAMQALLFPSNSRKPRRIQDRRK